MAWKSKYKGSEIESLLDTIVSGAIKGGGIEIVDSVDKLDPNAELGSMASVVTAGSIQETSFRNLHQPDASMLDQATGNLTQPELLSSVSSVKVFAPADINNVGFTPVQSIVYLVTRDFSMTVQNMAMIQIEPSYGVAAVTITGGYDMQQYMIAEFSQDTMSYTVHNDQVEAFNAVLANGMDWCYLGNPETSVITEEQFDTIDLFCMAVSSVPSEMDVWVKKDEWEKLYGEELNELALGINKIDTDLKTAVTELDAKIPTKVSQLENDNFYISLKKKTIIKATSFIELEDNTETHIKQCVLSGNFEIIIGNVSNRATLYIPVELGTTIKVTDVHAGYVLLQKSFDCGLIKFEFQKIDGTISINYTSIPQVRIDYIFKLEGSSSIYINKQGAALNWYYLDGRTISAEDYIVGEGEHHFTMISEISAEMEVKWYGNTEENVILGSSFVTKIILGNGVKNLPKIQSCPLLTELQLPQSLKYAKFYGGGAYFLNTPLLEYISVYTTDMLFRLAVGYSSSNSPGSAGLFSGGKKLKRYDDLFGRKPLVAPIDVRVALEGIWKGIEGLTSDQGIIYPNGLLSAGLNCMGVNVPFVAIPRNTNILDTSFQLENYNGSYDLLSNKYLAYIKGNSTRQENGFLFEDQFDLIEYVSSITIERSFSKHLFVGIRISTINLKTESVPGFAFAGSTVTNVHLENTIQIANGAFLNCSNISKLELPETLISIGEVAFEGCSSLNRLDFSKSTTIPYLGSYAFRNISPTCKIIVPDALYDEWIAATNWSTYASYIIKKSDWDASQTTE